jgi:phosphoglycolate phosphatase
VAPDALIFDLDGTLWDTSATCAVAWNRVLARLGIPYRRIDANDVRAVTGKPHVDAIRAAFGDLDEESISRIAAETETEDNVAIAEHGGELFPGVREHVPRLRQRLPLAIVSNCQKGYIEAFLAWSGLAHFVDHECWGNTGETKTANLRAVMARNDFRAPLFVGDTDGDREAARGAGARFVWASYGFGIVSEYDHRLSRFDEIGTLL